MGYGLFETSSESPVLICIFIRCVVPILVSSHTNCNSNVSNNWFSDFLTLPRRVWGRCESGWLNVFIYHLLCDETVDRNLQHMVNGCFLWYLVTYNESVWEFKICSAKVQGYFSQWWHWWSVCCFEGYCYRQDFGFIVVLNHIIYTCTG